MKKILSLIAAISFYIAAVCFFGAENNVAGGINLFSGTCFLLVYLKRFNSKA